MRLIRCSRFHKQFKWPWKTPNYGRTQSFKMLQVSHLLVLLHNNFGMTQDKHFNVNASRGAEPNHRYATARYETAEKESSFYKQYASIHGLVNTWISQFDGSSHPSCSNVGAVPDSALPGRPILNYLELASCIMTTSCSECVGAGSIYELTSEVSIRVCHVIVSAALLLISLPSLGQYTHLSAASPEFPYRLKQLNASSLLSAQALILLARCCCLVQSVARDKVSPVHCAGGETFLINLKSNKPKENPFQGVDQVQHNVQC